MKDIPVFTTENGVASLVLKEIPFRQIAYVKLLSSQCPEALLAEAVEFCRACGAERIEASGDAFLERFPLANVLVEMQTDQLENTDACVFPVTEKTVSQWREIYNRKMHSVPNASTMTWADEKTILSDGDCHFVHRDGALLGIGKASGNTIHAVAAVAPGAGSDVVKALAGVLNTDEVRLVVALENKKAMALYERLGFVQTREVSRWYKIL